MKKFMFLFFCAVATAFIVSAETLEFPAKLKKGASRNADGNVEVAGIVQNFKDFTVAPRQRYRITVSARIKAGNALENTPAMEELLGLMVWNPGNFPWKLPAIDYEYRGSGKRLFIRYHNTKLNVFSSKFREYKFDIYTLDNADALRFFVRANDKNNVVEIGKCEIVKVDMSKEKYLNANADFSLGDYNPGGFGYAHKGVFGKDNAGWYIDLGNSWAVCDAIPVTPGDKLKISYAGEAAANRRYMKFGVTFFDNPQFDLKKGKIGTNKLPMRLTAKEKSGSLIVPVPEGAKWMRPSFSEGLMRCIRIEKINGNK
ncbi:MAG: hypothetical protein E7054_05040 [Lentisphaerae bacterium]|nr:hypothetical protein [Lentisphaerota bacterium]